jgi:glycosyltransferase involved in cell wall biosynthesis
LEALKQIPSRDIELHLVGPVLDEIKPVLARFADDRIKVLGPVARKELPHHYQNADLFVFPSVNDAFGLVVLEAMASGLPVITTEHSCGKDVVNEGIDGFVTPIRDSEALGQLIGFFLEDPRRAGEMGYCARTNAESHFCSSQYLDRLTTDLLAVAA